MKKTCGFAIASLVFGILGLILGAIPLFGWALWILAIVLSIVALNRIKRDNNLEGKGLAVTGLILGLVALVLYSLISILFSSGIYWISEDKPVTYTDRGVHWQAYVDLTVCGEHVDLPCFKETSGTVHGEPFCGTPTIHHHYNNILHIEGNIENEDDITLGKFFDSTGITFDSTHILNYTNGDICPDGKPGVLKMYVNDKPRTDYSDYIPFATKDAQKQVIKITFG